MRKNTSFMIFVFVCIVAAVLSGLVFVNEFMQDKLLKQDFQTLQEINAQQVFNIDKKFEGDRKEIQALAEFLSDVPDDKEFIREVLVRTLPLSNFYRFGYALPNGNGFNNLGHEFNIATQEHFKRALKGETYLRSPFVSPVDGVVQIVMSTPVLRHGEVVAVLVGVYREQSLDNLVLHSMEGAGYSYLTTNDGTIIARSVGKYSLAGKDVANIFNFWKVAQYIAFDDAETMRKKLLEGNGGISKFSYHGNVRMVCYATTANNWRMFSLFPEEIIKEATDEIMLVSLVQTAAIIMLFIGLIAFIITSQMRNYAQVRKIAYTDELTGLLSFPKFKIDALDIVKARPQEKFLMCRFDISDFKMLNQMLGFETGNKVLRGIAQSLKESAVSESDIFARYNADDFICLYKYDEISELEELRVKFYRLLAECMGENFNYKITSTTAYYFLTEDVRGDISLAIERINMTHRKAKELKVPFYEYSDKLLEEARFRKQLENSMEKALANNEFIVHLQPKYSLSNEKAVGAEALVRWQTAHGSNLVYPNSFIPMFEENGFIVKLDMYVFEKCCTFIKKWIISGAEPVPISVNFSRKHLSNPRFVDELCDIADKYQVPHNLLEVEMLESTIFQNESILEPVYKKLNASGFALSMDDFGTGYSSLGLLKNIPIDVIKIDRSFFTNTNDMERASRVILSVIEMAKGLAIRTVAEGVETKENVELLRRLGCDMVQGYYYAKPMPLSDFEKLYLSPSGGVANV